MGYLAEPHITAEFFLTQVVSHHDEAAVAAFNEEFARQRIDLPGIFGVFYYRSANPRTLDTLKKFLPVPVEGLTREFAEGATPDEVCARTIRQLATRRRQALLRVEPAGRPGAPDARPGAGAGRTRASGRQAVTVGKAVAVKPDAKCSARWLPHVFMMKLF